jgi:hypothetical protein
MDDASNVPPVAGGETAEVDTPWWVGGRKGDEARRFWAEHPEEEDRHGA